MCSFARLEPPGTSHAQDPFDGIDQPVDLVARVIESQRWPDGGLQSEPPQRRLRAMMAGADRYPLEVQESADFLGRPVPQDE